MNSAPDASSASTPALVRYQQQLDALCAATLRALTGQAQLHFRGRQLYRADHRLPSFAPHLHPQTQTDDARSFRGAADGAALRLRYSDSALHLRLKPALPLARMVFDLLEQFRCASLVPDHLPGVRSNMLHRFDAWSLAFVRARLHESAQGILLLTVAQICHSRVTAEPVDESLTDLIEVTRFGLAPRIGVALAGLRRSRASQADYAEHALHIANTVAALVASEKEARAAPRQDIPEEDDEDAWLQLWVDFESSEEGGFAVVDAERESSDVAHAPYRAFTTAYDKEVGASSLVRAELLQTYRETLDQQIADAGISVALLARQIQALLAKPHNDDWDSGQEEGRIDGRRLAQLIASPTERRLFRTEHQEPLTHCTVGFLVDCSGSMKQHMPALTVMIDLLVRAMELAGISSQVLGYTTGAWNGGRALRDWRKAGKPQDPGRLNELCHIVFKDNETTWRRARRDIAALLKPDIFRECIDGEALRWANQRLEQVTAERKILIVVSDGSPMDSATVLANDPNYLDRDLQTAATQIERAGRIRLIGVGVGLDMSPFYQRSLVIDAVNFPLRRSLQDILKLLT
jgi:cobaltochelatase CobT